MNRKQFRDDSNKNRLCSFLYNQGGLTVNKLSPIKDNVFYLKSDNDEYILKNNKFSSSIEQQWNFFEKLTFNQSNKFTCFPNGSQIIEGFGVFWTLSPYISGQSLQYRLHSDREDALITLRKFHKEATDIKIENPKIKTPIYVKWYNRLEKLHQTRHIMEQFGFLYLYEDILRTTKSRLKVLANLDWHSIEKKSVVNWTWTHGDVASHNFLRDNSNIVHLIDFDLLSMSPQIYDHIQLGQRFLPYVNWSLDRLLSYSVYDEQLDFSLWLYGITVPSDIIREWWHFTSRNHSNNKFIWYLNRLSEDWKHRVQFVEEVDIMLR
ncbi:phosphotransferase [Aquibacillus halophilus]|uniref:phosphotransferase n=1 Tax=Aquibacillus halophilus TaxID=930132 RepID=UPI001478453E